MENHLVVIYLYYRYRACVEVRKLKWGDVKLPDKINGAEFLLWDIERGTKTRTGEQVQGHQRAFDPKAFATGGQRCPVMIYKLYKSHRPLNALRDDSPFFLSLFGMNHPSIYQRRRCGISIALWVRMKLGNS